MNKTLLIIKREYLTRVRKTSFIVMTLLGPLLLAAVMIVPIWLAIQEDKIQNIEVIDESYLFKDLIPENESINFDYPNINFLQAQEQFYDSDYDAILYIPPNVIKGKAVAVKVFYKNHIGEANEEYIKSTISKMIYTVLLAQQKVSLKLIKSAEANSRVALISEKLESSGKSKVIDSGLLTSIGLGLSLLIYMFIFLYGVQVMRGVMEEKSNRIVEIILSSVKPFQFMMGKIIGVGLVGLTQFLLWVILTLSLNHIAESTILKNVEMDQISKQEEVIKVGADLNYVNMNNIEDNNLITKLWNSKQLIAFDEIFISFLFYFLVGYLLYSALFAAIGSAVDHESDTQQFLLPITIPLVFSFVIGMYVMQNPDSSLAFWFSIFPLTSPIVMMMRIPFGVPLWEIALSMSLLFIGFIITTWLAAKIYRTGILLYGKKASWKEISKWLFR